MKKYLDANILVSVINKEYPLYTYTSRIVSLADHNRFEVYTSPLCLAIAFYFAEKKHKKQAKQKVKLLSEHISITDISSACVKKAFNNSSINYFEDGLEYCSALENKCNCIVTEDTSDFYFSEIEVLTSEAFFGKYMRSGK